MTRSFWIKSHLITASFFAPILLLIALSGGLYLVGIKGSVDTTNISAPADARLDLKSPSLEQDVRSLFDQLSIEHDFEYLRAGGNAITTRPTSRTYYVLKPLATGVEITRNVPNLQKRMIELHKGHGPGLFKNFQKATAIALLLILVSGAWLGLSSTGLRQKTIATMGAGLVTFLGFVFLT